VLALLLLLLFRTCGGCKEPANHILPPEPAVSLTAALTPAATPAPAAVPEVAPTVPEAPEVRRRVDAPPVAPLTAELVAEAMPAPSVPTAPTVPITPEAPEAPAPLTAELVAEAPEAEPVAEAPYDCCTFTNSLRMPALPRIIIKSNLLYDVALTPNLGVEVLLGERFSVGAEFMRGWWLKRDWSFCWQLEAAALEGRYWFRHRMERHLHGGWFAGIFAQAGLYDFQLNTHSGMQGEFVMAGVSGGYLCPLSAHWSIEFALGIGYLLSNYRRYTVAPTRDGHELVASAPAMRFKGLPYPIKAGVSLQWTIGWGKKRRDAQ
jgi:hypothetical protein